MNVLVDSCVFISFYDLDDSNHDKAVLDLEKTSKSNGNIWITEHIFDEVVNILLKRNHKKQLRDFARLVENRQISIFIPKNQMIALDLISKTMQLLLNQGRKKANYTDLYFVLVVKQQLLTDSKLLSYDHHLREDISLLV